MEYRKFLELLLTQSMKERANGYNFTSRYDETAINVVNAQTESERQVPFSTEQARLHMARLLSQMNRKIELVNDIDLKLLLTLLANIFPPQDDPIDYNFLQAALVASVSHAPQPQRQNELKTRQFDLGNDKSESQRGKRKQDAGDSATLAGESSVLDRILR